jgi:hypothetical protein
MKKTRFFIGIAIIFAIVSTLFGVKVQAASNEDIIPTKIEAVFDLSTSGQAYKNTLELVVDHYVTFSDKDNKDNADTFGYTLKVDDTMLKVEDANEGAKKITALKSGETTITLTKGDSEESTMNVILYTEDEYNNKKETDMKRSILKDIDAGEIDTFSNSTVPEIYFSVAKDNNRTLKINCANKVIWEFAPEDITDTTMKFVPNVEFSTNKFDSIENNTITDAIFIDFSHSGNLPGKGKASINVGTEKYGTGNKTLKLYYYNPSTKSYEYVEDVNYSNGIASLELTHCSTYALVDGEVKNESTNKELDNEPKTGESLLLATISLIAIISLAVAIIIKK